MPRERGVLSWPNPAHSQHPGPQRPDHPEHPSFQSHPHPAEEQRTAVGLQGALVPGGHDLVRLHMSSPELLRSVRGRKPDPLACSLPG